MRNRIWQYGLVWSCLAMAASPGWAQFGGGEGGSGFGGSGLGGDSFPGSGAGMGSMSGGMSMMGQPQIDRGRPTNIDLKDASLGQVVDLLVEESNPKKKSDGDEVSHPINILVSEKLRELKVGNVKLTQLYPKAALQAIAKLTDDSFVIEEVATGQVLVLRPSSSLVVVKAIRLDWLQHKPTPPYPGFGMGGIGDQQSDEYRAKEEEQRKQAAEIYQQQVDQNAKEIQQNLQEMLQAVDLAFAMHEEASGRSLPKPRLTVQERLNMVMVVGTPESVEIATEIINATNSEHNPPGQAGGAGGQAGGMMGGGGGGGGGFF